MLEVKVQSMTSQSEFRMKEVQNRTLAPYLPADYSTFNYEINDKDSQVKIKGERDLVMNALLNSLEFKPHCIFDSKNGLEIVVKFVKDPLHESSTYKIDLSPISKHQEIKTTFRGKLAHLQASDKSPQLTEVQGAAVKLSYPTFKGCPPVQAIFNADHMFEVNTPNLLNHILYLVRLTATHPNFETIEID